MNCERCGLEIDWDFTDTLIDDRGRPDCPTGGPHRLRGMTDDEVWEGVLG